MKKSKFLGPALTIALAFGFAFGTYAYNAGTNTLVPNNHYNAGSICPECIPDELEPLTACTLINSGVPCTCDFGLRLATTDGNAGEPPCVQLYKNPQ